MKISFGETGRTISRIFSLLKKRLESTYPVAKTNEMICVTRMMMEINSILDSKPRKKILRLNI
jgi:hypothetical protein